MVPRQLGVLQLVVVERVAGPRESMIVLPAAPQQVAVLTVVVGPLQVALGPQLEEVAGLL